MIGEILDDTYRVLERIGAGGMGEVYLVEHVHIGRREAIKVLRPEMAADQRLASRFRREARAINRLRHANIIGIYDFGQLPDGRLYLTMEHASGEQLDVVLRREGRLELPRALHLLHQMASAIDHAHSHGVVHRDLKPSNMMLVTERGHADVIKILDFGLAKVLNPTGPAGGGDELTLRGELFGTPEYMAPERLGDDTDDPRSDLYALGCIAHELLTGKPPFTGPRPLVMAAHMTQTAPPPGRNVNGVPPMFDTLVGQLLAKDPAVRLQSGQQLCAALEQVPGYPRRKAMPLSGAIFTSSSLTDGRAGFGGHVEVHEEVTLGDRARAPRQIAFADTASARTEEVRDEIFGALIELAQQALDHHRDDGRGTAASEALSIALALVHAVRDDRAHIGDERVELEDRQTRALQNAREREGSLRFAIAELRFDRGRTPIELHKDLDYQVAQLDTRVKDLAVQLRKDLDQIDERGIELAARSHDVEGQWVKVHARLREALAAHLAEVGGSAEALRNRFLVVGTAAEEMIAIGEGR